MSPWAAIVGCPVDGPPLWTFTTTHGVSVIAAYPIFSIIREKPGPDVAVIERAPAQLPPTIAAMLASSSSIWTNVPPTFGRRAAILSAISVDGVIGYPAKNLHPAARAPSAHAVFPL